MALALATKQQLAVLIAEGVPYSTVATIANVSLGRLSQLIDSDTELQACIAEKKAAQVVQNRAKIGKLEGLIDDTTGKLSELLTECTSFGEATTALQRLYAIQSQMRGAAHLNGSGQDEASGLNLRLGVIAQKQLNVVVNINQQIIEMDGRTVVPMDRAGVEKLFSVPAQEVEYTADMSIGQRLAEMLGGSGDDDSNARYEASMPLTDWKGADGSMLD
jgi:hypothetical protein